MAVDQSSRYMTKNRLAKQDERLYLGMFKYNHLNTIFWTLNLVSGSHTKKDRDKQSTVSHKRDNKNIYKYRVLILKVHFH